MSLKKIMPLIIAFFPLVLVAPMLIGGIQEESGNKVNQEKMVFDYSFERPSINTSGEYSTVQISGLNHYQKPGAPLIPKKSVTLLIPYGKKIAGINITAAEINDILGTYEIAPGQKPIPLNHKGPIEPTLPDKKIYGLKTAWPGNYYSDSTVQSKRGYQLLILNLLPVQYIPATGKISYAQKLKLEVQLADSDKTSIVRPLDETKERIRKMVQNPSALDSYPANKTAAETMEKQKGMNLNSPLKRAQKVKEFLGSLTVKGNSKQTESNEQPRIVKNKNGNLKFAGAPAGKHFMVSGHSKSTAQEITDTFIKENRSLLGNLSSKADFVIKRTANSSGRSFIHYKQLYRGLEIYGAEVIIQVNEEGGINSVVSDILDNTRKLDKGALVLEPVLDAEAAKKIAINLLSEKNPGHNFESTEPQLMIYTASLADMKGDLQLIWLFDVSAVDSLLVKERFLINASNGKVAYRRSLVEQAIYRRVRDEINYPDYSLNAILCENGDDPQARQISYPESGWGCDGSAYQGEVDDDLYRAYDYMGDVYNFYKDIHNRNSFDGLDSEMRSCVRVSNVYGPISDWIACWCGVACLGWGAVADDIVGHEFTHGMVNLLWQRTGVEADAIDESFCDMWGEWIDQTYNHNQDGVTYNDDNDDADVKWRIAEDWQCWDEGWVSSPCDYDNDCTPDCQYDGNCSPYCFTKNCCPVWRRMDDPTAAVTNTFNYGGPPGGVPQPDRYNSPYYCREGSPYFTGELPDDWYQCHHNLGVGNKLCYLLTDGDTFNGYTITGMGIVPPQNEPDKITAPRLFFEAINNLPSEADYYALGNALIRAAWDLGLNSSERANVIRACQAVEIFETYYATVGEDYNYVIVTNEELANTEGIYNFQALCDTKADRDIPACIVTTEWIAQNYDPDDYDPERFKYNGWMESSDFSICLWVKRGDSINSEQYILDQRDTAGDGWCLKFDSNNKVVFSLNNHDITSTDSITNDSKWHFIGVAIDRDAYAKIYFGLPPEEEETSVDLNGSDIFSSAEQINVSKQLHIGRCSYQAGSYFDGEMDNLMMFAKVLEEDDFSHYYYDEESHVYGTEGIRAVNDLYSDSMACFGFYPMNDNITNSCVENRLNEIEYPFSGSHNYCYLDGQAKRDTDQRNTQDMHVTGIFSGGLKFVSDSNDYVIIGDMEEYLDLAVSIRMFLMDAYNTWNTSYVLLGGDRDVVPVRRFVVESAAIATDIYYGCLESGFDYDHDGRFGEKDEDGPGGEDIDLFSEVYVGRAPVGTCEEVANFVKKTLTYENSKDSYLKNVLISGCVLGDCNFPYTDSGFKKPMGEIIHHGEGETLGFDSCSRPGCMNFNVLTLYDQDYNSPGQYIENFWWDGEHCNAGNFDRNSHGWGATNENPDLIYILNGANPPQIIYHTEHGLNNCDYNMKMYTGLWPKDGEACNNDIFGTLDLLQNVDKYFLVYTETCFPGPIAQQHCWSEEIVAGEYGAFAVISNSNVGLENVAFIFTRQFFDEIMREGREERLGPANQESKEIVLNTDIDNDSLRHTYFQLNLLGDPELRLHLECLPYTHSYYDDWKTAGMPQCWCALYTNGDYDDWAEVGKPDCWCGQFADWNFQCYGDADNKTEGFSKYRVYYSDYDLLEAAWMKKATQLYSIPNGICADFDHKAEGFSKYRVYNSDYSIMMSNWMKKATQLQPWCPLGQ